MRCITRIATKGTRGWEVRVIRRGIAMTEYFADSKFGGRTGALSEAMEYRDRVARELRPYSRAELARRVTARNTSGIPGVRRRIKPVKKPGGKIFNYEVWTASGSPEPNQRRTRDFYIGKLGEDDAPSRCRRIVPLSAAISIAPTCPARPSNRVSSQTGAREAAIGQRLRWEKQMERNERRRLPKSR